jgi:hypothetical protein
MNIRRIRIGPATLDPATGYYTAELTILWFGRWVRYGTVQLA